MYFRPNNRVALLLTAVLSGLMLLMGLAAALAGAATFSELDTNNQGEAYELFPAENGNLWLSDYGAGEVRQINPSGGVYTT